MERMFLPRNSLRSRYELCCATSVFVRFLYIVFSSYLSHHNIITYLVDTHQQYNTTQHNLFSPGKGSRYATSVVKTAADSSSDGTSAGNLKSAGSKPKQTQSSRGRIRVPSRRMQESYDPNKKLMDEKEDSRYHPFSGNQSMEGEEDVSTSDVSEDSSTVESGNKVAKKSSSSGGGGQKSFLECLFELVNDSSVDNPDILAW